MASTSRLQDVETFARASTQIRETVEEAADPERAIRGLLELGEKMLNVENAHVTQIEPAGDYWEAIESTDQHHGVVVPGQTVDLEETYCRRVIHEEDTISLSHASEQGWTEDPAYEEHGLECYLGTTVETGDEKFGTACFVKREPRSETFSTEEQAFVELLSFALGRLIERRRLATRIARQDELNAVLGRILRHNLRNELNVIHGRAELIAQQVSDELAADIEPLLGRLDALQALAEKSQNIDATVSLTIERQHIELADLVTTVCQRVQTEYPDTTFETSLSDITVMLAPSIERALTELVENAAKHGGDPPVVEIHTKTDDTSVVIEIADNGPGLSDQERHVLGDTAETPLQHGSGLGLWLVSWIVDNHNGEIKIVEFVDGTRIQLRFPQSAPVFT